MLKKAVIGMAFVMSALTLSVLISWSGTYTEAKTKTTETKDYQYDVNEDGVKIIRYTGEKKKVTVPAKIEGKDVVSVSGFSGTHVTSVTIPNSVTSIGGGVFRNCKKLKKVTLSKKITTIPYEAFQDCNSLTTVSMSGNVSEIGESAFRDCGELTSVGDLTLKEISFNAFNNCKKLAGTFTLDSSIEKVVEGSFYNCKKLAFRIPDKDLEVKELAFAGCSNISKRYISQNVSANAYAGCANIDTVIVKDDNVEEENGIYYSKDRKTLIYVRPDYSGTLDFLKQVDTIGAYAFSGFRQKKVEIPDNIVEIQEGAFYGAKCKSVVWNKNVKNIAAYMFMESALEKVVIPEGVETIGRKALWNMAKCVSVSIPASVQSWADYAPGDDFVTGVLEGFPVLKKVTVASGNTVFESKKGLLFSKTNRLLCYPAGKKAKTYKIPKNIKVWTHAFSNVKNLKVTFRFGSSIAGCFANCKNVRVVLPKSGIAFAGESHDMEWPLFENSTKCYAIVKKNSYVHKKFKKLVKKGIEYESAYAFKVA